MSKLVISIEQIKMLSKKAKDKLLNTLYCIEDELFYECKSVSETINYLQDNYKESKDENRF